MVMTIFAGIAEFERTLIISRTNDGRVAAKVRLSTQSDVFSAVFDHGI
jgi:DNA invertase Pin-like site-specific DNA recombinase